MGIVDRIKSPAVCILALSFGVLGDEVGSSENRASTFCDDCFWPSGFLSSQIHCTVERPFYFFRRFRLQFSVAAVFPDSFDLGVQTAFLNVREHQRSSKSLAS